jgi:hypothetical protein
MPAPDQHLISEARALLAQGWKQSHIARQLGITQPTLCRWLAAGEDAELVGTRCAASDASPARATDHKLTNDEQAALKFGLIAKRSRRLAAEHLIAHESCTDATYARLAAVLDNAADQNADAIWPAWYRRACVLTEEEKLGFRGAKALMKVEPARPRGRFFIEVKEDGVEVQHALFPGALWESDDESENTPSVSVDPETGAARVNRQTLKTIDVDSLYFLGLTSITRDKDAYTLEDQADHVLELVDAHGMPLRWRIERGPWDNNFWWGVPMPKDWWQTEDCPKYRFGGISADAGGPIKVMQAFKSRQKAAIEGSFNHEQNLNAFSSLDIGRFRGEFEDAARKLREAHAGRAKGVNAFPDQVTRADMSAEILRRFNAEAKRRRAHGGSRIVPAELWQSAQTRPLAAADRWRFLPVKKALTVRNAHISCKLEQHKGREFWFTAEGFQPQWDWQPYLPHGWRVFAVFHPHRLDLGCQIFNGVHPDSTKNPGRFPLGMPLGTLPLAEFAPQWREGHVTALESDPFQGRKQWHKTVQRETRAIKATRAESTRASFAAKGAQAVSARKGSPDPLAELHKGAPPIVGDVAIPQGSRSGADHITSSGEHGGRAGRDHEARRNSAGSLGDSASRLAELEAELAEL